MVVAAIVIVAAILPLDEKRGVAEVGPGGTRGAALSEGQRVAVGPLFLLSSSWGMARGPRGGTCRYAAQGCVLPRSFPVPVSL